MCPTIPLSALILWFVHGVCAYLDSSVKQVSGSGTQGMHMIFLPYIVVLMQIISFIFLQGGTPFSLLMILCIAASVILVPMKAQNDSTGAIMVCGIDASAHWTAISVHPDSVHFGK